MKSSISELGPKVPFHAPKFCFGIGGLPYDLTEGDILCVFSQ